MTAMIAALCCLRAALWNGPGSDYDNAYWNEFLAAGGNKRLEPTVKRSVLGSQAAPDLSGIYESTSLVGFRVCGSF